MLYNGPLGCDICTLQYPVAADNSGDETRNIPRSYYLGKMKIVSLASKAVAKRFQNLCGSLKRYFIFNVARGFPACFLWTGISLWKIIFTTAAACNFY